jgi:phosphatidate cytidylyltransferase
MTFAGNSPLFRLVAGILAILVTASLAGWAMKLRATTAQGRSTVANFNARTKAWWVMCGIFLVAASCGRTTTIIFFALTSFLALREFITLTPTRAADHRTLFWMFAVMLPYHYVLLGLNMYGMFLIFIPVYAFLFIPIRSALQGDTQHFLQRAAVMQWGLAICVYCISYAAALLDLPIPGYEGRGAGLLLFLLLVCQLSDVFQYVWGKLLGRRKINDLSPNKTWEGLVLGGASATGIGAGLWWVTPFSPIQAAGMALVIVTMGFLGGQAMSAIKRDRVIKDYGNLIAGHGGVLDRMDSVCFAAPVFYHLTRYFFAS